MKKTFRVWAGAAIGLAIVTLSSCAYDPYYGSSAGVSYSSGGSSLGYGDGYGYGNSSFSTSIFVSTGNPRWGYDPYTYSYYDYTRRAYYDPYLYGYYPVGFRPYRVYGVPHPHGWRPGRGYCPPPSRIRSTTLSGYRNRESLYRNTNYSWARSARQDQSRGPSQSGFRPQTGRDGRDSRDGRFGNSGRESSDRFQNRSNSGFRPQTTQPSGNTRIDSGSRFPGQREGTPDRGSREGFQRPGFQNSGQRDGTPDRGSREGFQRPGFQNSGQRPDRRPSSPTGFNNPVGIRESQRTGPSASQIQRPSRSPSAQQPRFSPQQRPSATQSEAAPSRSRGEGRPQMNSGGGGREFRGRSRD